MPKKAYYYGVAHSNRTRTVSPSVRFWRKVDKDGPLHPVHGKCWTWLGGFFKDGYGQFDGKAAHRASYSFSATIPPGIYVLHKCDNHACVNPDHLFLGTQKDNIRDMVDKGRARYKTRPAGWRQSVSAREKIRQSKLGKKMRKCVKCELRLYRAVCKKCQGETVAC